MFSLYSAVDSTLDNGSDGGWFAKAASALADAETVVARRDAKLHYPVPSQILGPGANSTLYQSGFLTEAATLCYWTRETLQALEAIGGDASTPPGCVP
jgi:hypothetical protein